MSQVCFAGGAGYFGATHEEFVVGALDYRIWGQGAKKAGPSGARVELCVRVKQPCATAGAGKCPLGFWEVVVGECPLGPAFSGYLEGKR